MQQGKITRRGALMALGTTIAAGGLGGEAFAATGDSATLESAVEALRKALESGDGAVLQQLLHDHVTYSHSDGRVWTKDVIMENIAGKKRYVSIVTSQQTVDIVGDVGIVRHTYDVVNNDEKKSTSHIKVLLCWAAAGSSWKLLARSGCNAPV